MQNSAACIPHFQVSMSMDHQLRKSGNDQWFGPATGISALEDPYHTALFVDRQRQQERLRGSMCHMRRKRQSWSLQRLICARRSPLGLPSFTILDKIEGAQRPEARQKLLAL